MCEFAPSEQRHKGLCSPEKSSSGLPVSAVTATRLPLLSPEIGRQAPSSAFNSFQRVYDWRYLISSNRKASPELDVKDHLELKNGSKRRWLQQLDKLLAQPLWMDIQAVSLCSDVQVSCTRPLDQIQQLSQKLNTAIMPPIAVGKTNIVFYLTIYFNVCPR